MTLYVPHFPDHLVGPGRFFIVPRFGASVVLSLARLPKSVEVPYGRQAWFPVREGETAYVVSGYPEVVQFARSLDAVPEPVPFREELTSDATSD